MSSGGAVAEPRPMEVEEMKKPEAEKPGAEQKPEGAEAVRELERKRPRAEGYRVNAEFVVHLCANKIESIPPPENKVYVAWRHEKIQDVWRGLIEHNVLSAPVLTSTERHAGEAGHYFGFIDMADILHYVTQHFDINKMTGESINFWDITSEQKDFASKTVNDLMNIATPALQVRRLPWHPVLKGYSLFSAFESLARQPGVFRLPVLKDGSHVYSIVTQTMMLNLLYTWDIGSIKSKPLMECNNLLKPVVCIKEDQQAIQAFNVMSDSHITGVGVQDASGKLTGNISVRDLKFVGPDIGRFWRLMLPASRFLDIIGSNARLVTCKKEETLGDVINKLHSNRVHRVYICDELGKPIGICSIKDILIQILDSL